MLQIPGVYSEGGWPPVFYCHNRDRVDWSIAPPWERMASFFSGIIEPFWRFLVECSCA